MSISRNKWYKIIFFQGSSKIIILIITCLVIASYLGHLVPSYITELSKNYYDKDLFYYSIKKIFYLFLFVYINRAAYQWLLNFYIKDLMGLIREICFSKWLLNYDLLDENNDRVSDGHPMGEVIARIMSDTLSIRELITSGTFAILINIVFVVSYLISFIEINSFVGWILAVVEAFASVLLIWGSKYMRDIFHSVRKTRGKVSQTVASVVGGFQDTYYTNHLSYASKTSNSIATKFMNKQLQANVWDSGYYSVAESLYPLLLALVVFILPASNITDAAIIFGIVDLIQRSIDPVKNIAGKIANIQRALTGITRINEFTVALDKGHSSPIEKINPLYNLRSLHIDIKYFAYPSEKDNNSSREQFSLNNIKMDISRGKLIGIVGTSGCGKSTLLNILSGNIIPNNGSIVINLDDRKKQIKFPGNDIDAISEYREQVGIISQDSHTFSESLLFNISFEKEISDEFIHFWRWIIEEIPYLKSWGKGPLDQIYPNELSVGQKQLISAIRACYLKKIIVLFDEISSALDSELEEALRKVIFLVQKYSLTFIVAHRLETVINADTLILMEDGRVLTSGTHSDLLERSIEYSAFASELISTDK